MPTPNGLRAPLALASLTLGLAACLGEVSAPPAADEIVARVTFVADKLNALSAKECTFGAACVLPNTKDCQRLEVEVRGDGGVAGRCTIEGGQVLLLTSPRDIPLQCRSSLESYSVQCLDWRLNVALVADGRRVEVYPPRGSASVRSIGSGLSDLPDGAGFLPESPGAPPKNPGQTPPPSTPSTPAGPPEDTAACAAKARDVFVGAMNATLQGEGLSFGYTPTKGGNSAGFFNHPEFQSNPALLCEQTQKPPCDKKAVPQKKCYCWNGLFGGTCKGAPMVDAALAAACGKRPPECTANTWATKVWDESRGAINWLQAAQQAQDAAKAAAALGAALGLASLLITADPLILDLDGDGIALTSAAEGVLFDVAGAGPTRTAWVRGKDDALLALDRDGNGRIDDGTELLGDAFQLGGRRASDGFAALALLDTNHDGRVDERDALFSRLRLWRDANRDGRSQPHELSPLAAAGVSALLVRPRHVELTDGHGNDLSLQGCFVRSDGQRGRMIDALLVTR